MLPFLYYLYYKMYARNFLYCMQSTTTEQATKLRKKLEIANSILQNLAKNDFFINLNRKRTASFTIAPSSSLRSASFLRFRLNYEFS